MPFKAKGSANYETLRSSHTSILSLQNIAFHTIDRHGLLGIITCRCIYRSSLEASGTQWCITLVAMHAMNDDNNECCVGIDITLVHQITYLSSTKATDNNYKILE